MCVYSGIIAKYNRHTKNGRQQVSEKLNTINYNNNLIKKYLQTLKYEKKQN